MEEIGVVNFSFHQVTFKAVEIEAGDSVVIFTMQTVLNNKPEDWLHLLRRCTYFALIKSECILFALSKVQKNGTEIHKHLHRFLLEKKISGWDAIRITDLNLALYESGIASGSSYNSSREIPPLQKTERALINFINHISQSLEENVKLALLSEEESTTKPAGKTTLVINGHAQDTPMDLWGATFDRIDGYAVGKKEVQDDNLYLCTSRGCWITSRPESLPNDILNAKKSYKTSTQQTFGAVL